MAVAADNGHAGQARAQFRPDHVHNALTDIVQRNKGHAELGHILNQGLDLKPAFRIGDLLVPVGRRHIVVRHGQGGVGTTHLAAIDPQAFKGLGAGDFVHQMAVDIEKRRTVRQRLYVVSRPDLVIQGLGRARLGLVGHAVRKAGLSWTVRSRLAISLFRA